MTKYNNKCWEPFGTIYEILAAPISTLEVVLAFVGAGATKTLIVSIIIFITSLFFVDVQVKYPLLMIFLLILGPSSTSHMIKGR